LLKLRFLNQLLSAIRFILTDKILQYGKCRNRGLFGLINRHDGAKYEVEITVEIAHIDHARVKNYC
jgi:hypothetical protein